MTAGCDHHHTNEVTNATEDHEPFYKLSMQRTKSKTFADRVSNLEKALLPETTY